MFVLNEIVERSRDPVEELEEDRLLDEDAVVGREAAKRSGGERAEALANPSEEPGEGRLAPVRLAGSREPPIDLVAPVAERIGEGGFGEEIEEVPIGAGQHVHPMYRAPYTRCAGSNGSARDAR